MELGTPARMDPGNLPTCQQVFSHYLYLRSENIGTGEWKINVPQLTVVREVMNDVLAQWGKTPIPHEKNEKYRLLEKKITNIVKKCQQMMKKPVERRGTGYGQELNQLFDISLCNHKDFQDCNCDPVNQVPPNWREFLLDQRSDRQSKVLYSERVQSLRGGVRDLTVEEKEAQEKRRMSDEAKVKKHQSLEKRKRKAAEDIDKLFTKVNFEDNIENYTEDNETVEDEASEWEDVIDKDEEIENRYNTLKLKNFSRAVDRYQYSDRGAAKVANGLLKDLGLVTKNNTALLIGPSKVRRERQKWGRAMEDAQNAKKLPCGIYTDGKKTATLVRDVVETKVKVPGGKGRGAYRVVKTVSNKKEVQDHYPIVAEPGGSYVTHVTPRQGTGKDIAKEIVSVVQERGVKLKVMGMDGCSVNTGIHRGVIRCVEVELGEAVQHAVCLLHGVELYFDHVFVDIDGMTVGPGTV